MRSATRRPSAAGAPAGEAGGPATWQRDLAIVAGVTAPIALLFAATLPWMAALAGTVAAVILGVAVRVFIAGRRPSAMVTAVLVTSSILAVGLLLLS